MARRSGGPGGRFDHRFEADSIEQCLVDEMQEPFGSSVDWYVYNTELSTIDPIYDVAQSDSDGGLAWTGPFYVPIMSANLNQGNAPQTEHEGFYNVDQLHIVAAIDTVRQAGIHDIATNPSRHLADRIIWRGEVWKPTDVQPRGLVGPSRYVILGMDLNQISEEEMVNDTTFQKYAGAGLGTRDFGSQGFGDGEFG